MIHSFGDQGTEDLFDGESTRAARNVCPESLWTVARRKLEYLDSAHALSDLMSPPGNRLEALKGSRRGQHGIRINERYRICFTCTDGAGALGVEVVDYHDER